MPHPRFQFSIRWIFAVTAIVGLALAALSAEPKWISSVLIQLIFLVMPGLVAVMLVAGGGYARAFAIGALAPALIGVPIVVWFLIAVGTPTFSRPYSPSGLAEKLFGRPADFMRVLAVFIWSST